MLLADFESFLTVLEIHQLGPAQMWGGKGEVRQGGVGGGNSEIQEAEQHKWLSLECTSTHNEPDFYNKTQIDIY